MKLSSSVLTIIVSVALSVLAVLCTNKWAGRDTNVVKTKRLEIVDQLGKTRCMIETIKINGQEFPRLVFQDSAGHPVVILNANTRNEGALFFNSEDTEGKVVLGYLNGGDAIGIDNKDPIGGWGVVIRGKQFNQVAIGIANNGSVYGASQVSMK